MSAEEMAEALTRRTEFVRLLTEIAQRANTAICCEENGPIKELAKQALALLGSSAPPEALDGPA